MWQNLQETVDLVTFTEEILNGKLHFLCSGVTFFHQNVKKLDVLHFLLDLLTFCNPLFEEKSQIP